MFCPTTRPSIVTDCPLAKDPTVTDVELAEARINNEVAATDPIQDVVSQTPPVQNRALSASRRFTRPFKTLPPALTHNINSSAAPFTLPAFKTLNMSDDLRLPHPRLKTHDERAENWFELIFTLTLVATHFS